MNGIQIEIPEQYHPNEVGGYVILSQVEDINYLEVVNIKENVTTEFISWAVTYAVSKDMNVFWVVNGKNYALGSGAFIEAMNNKVRSEKVEE